MPMAAAAPPIVAEMPCASRKSLTALRKPDAMHRPAAVEHGGADVGQDRIGGRYLAPPLVQAGVHVLHDVFGGGQVPDHEHRQPDQLRVVLTEQRGHGGTGQVRGGVRRREISVSHRFRPSDGRLGNRSKSHV